MNQAPASNKPKSNVATIVIIIVAVLVMLGIVGYFVSRYIANKAADALTDAATESVTESLTNSAISQQWPTNFTMQIPEYQKGKVSSVVELKNPRTWDIIIAETTKADYDSYISQVKAAGWVQQGEAAFLVDFSQFKKDNWDLTVVWDASSNGVKITLVEPVTN